MAATSDNVHFFWKVAQTVVAALSMLILAWAWQISLEINQIQQWRTNELPLANQLEHLELVQLQASNDLNEATMRELENEVEALEDEMRRHHP